MPIMMVSLWSLRATTIAFGLASTMEMLETLFPGTMTSLSAPWIGTETPILVRRALILVGSRDRGGGTPKEGRKRMKRSGVRLPSGKDQGKQENRGEDFYSGEGMESLDSFFNEANSFLIESKSQDSYSGER